MLLRCKSSFEMSLEKSHYFVYLYLNISKKAYQQQQKLRNEQYQCEFMAKDGNEVKTKRKRGVYVFPFYFVSNKRVNTRQEKKMI
jgi:hypothetical protein